MARLPSYVLRVREWFGLPALPGRRRAQLGDLPQIGPGQLLLITGPSGSGKSTLLRRIVNDKMRGCPRIWPERIALADRAVCDLFPGWGLEEVLGMLSRVGLGEAHTYVLRPRYLSQGQRFRLRLALALAKAREGPLLLACDEFASKLDGVTAAVVARLVRKAVDRTPGLRAILATPREGLAEALGADFVLECDFGSFRW